LNLKKIILFASGSGSNVQKICEFFEKDKATSVEMLVCNNPKALVVRKAKVFKLKSLIIEKESFYNSPKALTKILKLKPDLIVLAGFLWKIPSNLLEAFPNKIINIHPALLPKYGGKGMFGMHIHKSIIENKESKSGITIHYVNEKYDEGTIIFQKEIVLQKGETATTLSKRTLELEHHWFPRIIEKVLNNAR
tara:strand:+ start:2016 stop:2594 length:579 start_codon:yes stop_codon:yes gene_type:complete